MKKWLPWIIVAIVAIGLYTKGKGFYNNVISHEENIGEQWSKVESAYQLRSDLIPSLMKVAERYAEYEQETFKIVTDARSKATSIQIDPSNITPEQLNQFKKENKHKMIEYINLDPPLIFFKESQKVGHFPDIFSIVRVTSSQ